MRFGEELEKVYKPILPSLLAVDDELKKRLSTGFLPILGSFVERGKRLRPASLLFASGFYENVLKDSILLAVAIELIHASSLVHDDIVDEARIRRDEEALNTRYGNSVAVLVGDYVFSTALLTANEVADSRMMEVLMRAVMKMIEGEFEEEILPLEEQLEEDTYLSIIEKKTASLFEVSFLLGGFLGDWSEEERDALKEVGYNFGMAFQIIDDCLDIFGEEDSDLAHKKLTLPVIYTVKNNASLTEYLTNHGEDKLREEILNLGGLEYALKRADDFIEEGISIVEKIKRNDVKEAITNFLLYLRKRKSLVLNRVSLS